MEIQSGGAIPGLRLFQAAEEQGPSFWSRLSSLFAFEPVEYEEIEYEDLSGNGWTGGDGEDWEDDFAETLVIIGLTFGIMGLVWLRGAWTRWEENRRRREAEQLLEQGQRREIPIPPPIPL